MCLIFFCPTDFCSVKLSLSVHYPDSYPDVIPDLSLEPLEGDLDEAEMSMLLDGMRNAVCPLLLDRFAILSALIRNDCTCGIGRRKHWDGYDVRYGHGRERTAVYSHTQKNRRASTH